MTNVTQISARIQHFRESAQDAKNAFVTIRDTINAETSRTSEWKRTQISEARTNLARRLEELESLEKNYIASTTTELETSVFGMPSGGDVLAYRDAQDRVRNIHWSKEDEALELYRQATRSGDTTLKQALSERAVDAGWAKVQDAYRTDNPNQSEKLEALHAIQQFTTDIDHSMQAATDYGMPTR